MIAKHISESFDQEGAERYLICNNAFYRYGFLDFDVLEKFISDNHHILETCRYRNYYIPFMQEMQRLAQILAPEVDTESAGKTLLKLIDEYNYAKFNKQWV